MWSAMSVEIVTQPDQLAELAGVRAPTLVVVGEEDKVFVAVSEAIAGAVPGARYDVIPTAGHSPQFENPDAWRASLRSFLGSLG